MEVATAAVAVSAATMRGCPRDEADEAEIEAENRLSIGGEDAAASGLYIPLIFSPGCSHQPGLNVSLFPNSFLNWLGLTTGTKDIIMHYTGSI